MREKLGGRECEDKRRCCNAKGGEGSLIQIIGREGGLIQTGWNGKVNRMKGAEIDKE